MQVWVVFMTGVLFAVLQVELCVVSCRLFVTVSIVWIKTVLVLIFFCYVVFRAVLITIRLIVRV